MFRIASRSQPNNSPITPGSARSQEGSVAVTLAVWMSVQTLALTLAGLRVPLWARAPEAGEILAAPILLIVQILSASLFSPRLTSTWRSTLMAIACTWPYSVLAGFLGATSLPIILLAGSYVTAWLIVLWTWQAPLAKVKGASAGAAIAATWSAAGPLLLFVHIEYGGGSMPDGRFAQIAVGPIAYALQVLDLGSTHPLTPWLVLLTMALIGGGTQATIKIVARSTGGTKWGKAGAATDTPRRARTSP